MSTINKKDLVLLAKTVEWQMRLDTYTDEQLTLILAIFEKVKKEVEAQLAAANMTVWSTEQSLALLEEIGDILLGVATKLGRSISDATATAGVYAHQAHSTNLSFNGAAGNVVVVGATADQLKAVIDEVPVGGRLLQEWVDRAFTANFRDKIKTEIATGIIKGESYRQVAGRIQNGFPATRRELQTLVKTYIQSVNVQAMNQVYAANPNIIKRVRWHATMEPRSRSGRGTCLRCAGLDGLEFEVGKHPDCPLHPNCRCVLIPITASNSKMGLSQKDINQAARPYRISEDKVIGMGVTRKGESGVTHANKYSDWFKTLSPVAQKNALGPARYELLESGKIKFADLVDHASGKLKTLHELAPAMFDRFGNRINK